MQDSERGVTDVLKEGRERSTANGRGGLPGEGGAGKVKFRAKPASDTAFINGRAKRSVPRAM